MADERPSGSPGRRLDVELAALAAAGDRAAYGELARRHAGAVRALLRRLGADPGEADDLAQDAFLAGFERIEEFRGEGAFAGWIRRIAARLFVRRARRRLHNEARARELLRGADEEVAPIGAAVGREERLDLDAALEGLPLAERVCLSLAYGAGFSHAEIAETLDCPLGTVKSHVKRGLAKLRTRLAPEGAPAGAGRRGHG